MPSTYAHYRFGNHVYQALPESIKAEVDKNKDLFLIGLHGPDILFYYKALQSNFVNKIGFGMHDENACIFFNRCADIIRNHPKEQGLLAYLYGFVCHFTLDSECHTYIEKKINQSGVSHTEIETEFDRMLMIKDHKDPLTNSVTKHIQPTRQNAELIQYFFPQLSVDQVQESLQSMIKYNNFLIAPGTAKRLLIKELLRISGNYKEMHGLLVNKEANPECEDSNWKLYQLYCGAVPLAIELMEDYRQCLQSDSAVLCHRFGRTYGPEMEEVWEAQNQVV